MSNNHRPKLIINDYCKKPADSLILLYQSSCENNLVSTNKDLSTIINCLLEKKNYKFYEIHGLNLVKGYFLKQDINFGMELLNEAYINDNESAGLIISSIMFDQDSISTAVRILNELVAKNNYAAFFELAHIYLYGYPQSSGNFNIKNDKLIDYPKGRDLLIFASENNEYNSQIELGLAYSKGNFGLNVDKNQALKYFNMALNNKSISDIPGLKDNILDYINELDL